MAILERTLTGNFDQVLRTLDQAILNGSMSASYEDGTVYYEGEAYRNQGYGLYSVSEKD